MARSKVYFDTSFWDNAAIQEDFTVKDKLFYIYLLTNSQAKGRKKYTISEKRMAFDLGFSSEELESILEKFEHSFSIIKYDEGIQSMEIDDSSYFLFRK